MAKNNMKLNVEVGSTRMAVDCNNYRYEVVEELRELVADIRRKHSIFSKYPMDEEETKEKWRARVEPEIELDLVRKDGEKFEDHLKRMFEAKTDSHEMAPEILNAIAKVFSLREVSIDDFKKSNWLDVKAFIYDILSLGDIPAEDFYPKRPLA
jgi:hypothetical protein